MMVPHGCLSAEFSPSTITDRGVGIMRNKGTAPARTGKHGKRPRTFAITAARFREARFAAGLSLASTAQLLRVSLRTVQCWESGTHRIPYSSYKLLRVLRGHHFLRHPVWRDWRVYEDRLITPEGHVIRGGDLTWWNLMCRMADQFRAMVRDGSRRTADVRPSPDRRTGAQGGASVASAGLVSIFDKSQTTSDAPLHNKGFQRFNGATFGPTLGPQFGLTLGISYGPPALGETQLPSPGLSQGPGSGHCRPGQRLPQLGSPEGLGELRSVPGASASGPGQESPETLAAARSPDSGCSVAHGSQGGCESALSVRLWPEIQALLRVPGPLIGPPISHNLPRDVVPPGFGSGADIPDQGAMAAAVPPSLPLTSGGAA